MIDDYEDFWTVKELSVIYRVSVRTVYRILQRHNVRKRRNRKYRRKRIRSKARSLKPCGTNAAYQRHRRAGEYPCTPCLEAHAADVARYK